MAKAPSFFILIVWSFFQCLYIQIFLHFLMVWLQALFLGWQVAFTKVYCAFCKSVFSRERVKTWFFVREIKLNPLRKTVFKKPSLNRVKQKIEEILKILATLHASDTYFLKETEQEPTISQTFWGNSIKYNLFGFSLKKLKDSSIKTLSPPPP